MYLPNRATIDEACEWLQHQTGQKWTLPRLLEDGHLVPYVWIDYVEGLPQIFGDRREGYLTKMVYHGDVVRLAADRNEALLTMFTAHDGNLIRPTLGWRVELKDIRFLKNDLQRVAEIINKSAQPQEVPVAPQEQRQADRWQMCVDAGLPMPTDTYSHLPRGIGKIAKALKITRQALQQDLNAYRERLFGK